MAKKKVTSSDVAKRAGVSQATVSMVLNKKYNVSFSKKIKKTVWRFSRRWRGACSTMHFFTRGISVDNAVGRRTGV